MASNLPAIPEPQLTLESMRESIMSLKEMVENFAGQRGPASTTAATSTDLSTATTNLQTSLDEYKTTAAGLYVPKTLSINTGAGSGLTGGGDLSTDRSLSLSNTGVTSGSYTRASITVDAQGRLSAAANGASELPAFVNGGLLKSSASSVAWSRDSTVVCRGTVATPNTSTTTLESGSVNVSSVTRTGTGTYKVTFATALASTEYQPIVMSYVSVLAAGVYLNFRTVNDFTIYFFNSATQTLQDPVNTTSGGFYFVVYGGW